MQPKRGSGPCDSGRRTRGCEWGWLGLRCGAVLCSARSSWAAATGDWPASKRANGGATLGLPQPPSLPMSTHFLSSFNQSPGRCAIPFHPFCICSQWHLSTSRCRRPFLDQTPLSTQGNGRSHPSHTRLRRRRVENRKGGLGGNQSSFQDRAESPQAKAGWLSTRLDTITRNLLRAPWLGEVSILAQSRLAPAALALDPAACRCQVPFAGWGRHGEGFRGPLHPHHVPPPELASFAVEELTCPSQVTG